MRMSIFRWFTGYFSNSPEKSPVSYPQPQLTDEQICYNLVDAIKKQKNGLHFDDVYELMLRKHWRFSDPNANAVSVLDVFTYETKLLDVDYDDHRVYATPLAINPDDRTTANMLIASFGQMPDRDNPDIFMGGEGVTVNQLIEDLRELNPRGLRLVELHRGAEERVRQAKSA